jgi:hypothetical protein
MTIVMAVLRGMALMLALAIAGEVLAQPTVSVTPQTSATPFCPSDRPHRLEIETGTMSCSAQTCLGRMDCGTGTCKISRDLGDHCNSCSMRTYVACLSEQDLKAIRR